MHTPPSEFRAFHAHKLAVEYVTEGGYPVPSREADRLVVAFESGWHAGRHPGTSPFVPAQGVDEAAALAAGYAAGRAFTR